MGLVHSHDGKAEQLSTKRQEETGRTGGMVQRGAAIGATLNLRGQVQSLRLTFQI
jgi:hypothetical protein